MKKDATSIIDSNTRTHIRSLKKHVTVLFTDIVDSTKYWDKFGDVQGRLMVDRHNRLLFPLVGKFKGRLIKTIGDSIMASFAKPEYAVEAAVAMQQAMAMERQGDDTFRISIRIGIHTGDAIVEKEDVYGDCVNVAARVESISEGDEILVSQATVAYIDDEYAFNFTRKGWFVPKGKDKKLYVFTCDWKNHPLLIDQINNNARLTVTRRGKFELAFFLATLLGVLYFIYHNYIRYLVSDSENAALLYLNYSNILENYPYLTGFVGLCLLTLLVVFIRLRTLPLLVMRLIKGGFVFSLGFILMYLVANFLPIKQDEKWNQVLHSSRHHYVKVVENNSRIYEEPSLGGQEIGQIGSGRLLLQLDFQKIEDLAWNKVLLGVEKFGWIVRVSPPEMGVPEKIVSQEYRFNFRYKDLYVFALGFLCFLIGFWKFQIRPI